MKTTGAYKIWQVIYPVGIYYVVSSMVYFALEMIFRADTETYMLRQLICAAATIPFILSFYRQDKVIEDTVYGKKKLVSGAELFQNILVAAVTGAALGIGVNNVIAMTPLIQVSAGFAEANRAFFAGGIAAELLGSCLIIPIAEELLYRGVVYKRLRLIAGVLPAIGFSAVIFGVMHVNLVQFLYAGILGLLLAFLLEKTGFMYMPVVGHIAANVAAVVRQETGWLSFSYEPTAAGIGFTLCVLLFAAGLIVWQVRVYRNRSGE